MLEMTTSQPYLMYGIINCDTIKKARRYLQDHAIPCQFHDYRQDGLDADLLQRFIDQLGWQPLLNTRGTTWRKLSEEVRQSITDATAAKALMLEHPALIKRPLLVQADRYLLGFNATSYQQFITGN